ncbi:hypothetical protein GEMRC1_002880 [Eukaryota sp. GEM-RC1]
MKTFIAQLPVSSSTSTAVVPSAASNLKYSFGLSFNPAIQFLGNHKIPFGSFLSQFTNSEPKDLVPEIIHQQVISLIDMIVDGSASLVYTLDTIL